MPFHDIHDIRDVHGFSDHQSKPVYGDVSREETDRFWASLTRDQKRTLARIYRAPGRSGINKLWEAVKTFSGGS